MKWIKKQQVYIPTAFSPNGDGSNDRFMIYSNDDAIRNINSFRVFDRWGELVFEQLKLVNPMIHQPDGMVVLRGQKMNAAVFVYIVEVEWNDGRVTILQGDVTLLD